MDLALFLIPIHLSLSATYDSQTSTNATMSLEHDASGTGYLTNNWNTNTSTGFISVNVLGILTSWVKLFSSLPWGGGQNIYAAVKHLTDNCPSSSAGGKTK